MPAIKGLWTNTPNKTDHSIKGYTSKILLNYQATGTSISVPDGADIVGALLTNAENIKGTNVLPPNYFNNADGRTFRISLYCLKTFDGNGVVLQQRLYDPTNDVTYEFGNLTAGPQTSGSGEGLVKYECYFSYFENPTGDYIVQANTSVIYQQSDSSTSASQMLFASAWQELYSAYGINIPFEIKIRQTNGAAIYPISLMIEEIS
jgi:hypothetical protein